MNKFLELLEEYCQWLAIAIGSVFLIWVLWTYIFFSPARLPPMPDGTVLVPGNVDDYVKKNQADPVQHEIDDPTPPAVPTQHTDVYVSWHAIMDGTNEQIVILPPRWPGSLPRKVKLSDLQAPALPQVLVQALPTVPPSDSLDIKSARAFIAPAPAVAAAGAAPAPAAAPVGAAAGRDVNYVRLTYRINPAEIDKAFKAVHVPPQALTNVVQTTLYRQEQDANGNWTAPEKIAVLSNGPAPQALPPANAALPDITTFRAWAESDQGQSDLLRPAFYQVLSGEGPWDAPVDDLTTPAAVDPEKAHQLQLEEARKAAEERQKRDAAERAARAGAAGTTPPRTPTRQPTRRPKGSGVANDPSRPQDMAELAGLQLAQVPPPNVGFMGADTPPAPGAPAAPAAPAGPVGLPPANFSPAAVTNPIIGWAYDDTVKEGHTYRYQVVYSIRNPVYGANANVVANPGLATVFSISSAINDNSWSAPVTVKPTTEFYLANQNWPPTSIPTNVRVEVFKWANGKWQSKIFTVAAGDHIGADDGKTNFQTTDTLIDIRYDKLGQGRPYVLVMGANGELSEREPALDRNNPRRKQLNAAIQGPAGAGGTAAPPPPGG